MGRINQQGQFIPMAAMVMFTAVVFLVAVVNVYNVSRAKLKIQNLADAAALNIASQMASSLNKVSDLNEWMNHFVEVSPSGPSKPGEIADCTHVSDAMPPLSCAENATTDSKLYMFGAPGNAVAYASLVQTINKSQQMFITTYNNFIGAGGSSNSSVSTNSTLRSILLGDIPELADAGTSVAVWNYQGGGSAGQTTQTTGSQTQSSLNTDGMQPLKFKVHGISVSYHTQVPILNTPGPDLTRSLGDLLATGNQPSTPIGWMELDNNAVPQLNVKTSQGTQPRIGVGVRVMRTVQVLSGLQIPLSAEAEAYVVQGSGAVSDLITDPQLANVKRPIFKPTYWVKLVGAK